MSRRRSRPARQPPGITACCFCGFSEEDEVEYGKIYTHNGIITHYYCLLLSSNMEQNGNDNEGILGFMPTDIQKELRRGKRLTCSYCRRTGATLGCCNTRCKRVFHLPCGLRAGSLHQFFGEFRSYCITHRIKQEINEHIKEEAAAAGVVTCYICYEEVNPQNTIRTLWAPCCRKNAWFHRKCVQRLALSAGYFFKCPLCNNKQEFQQAMLEHGIFIPNQDASWELVPNAYQELLHRHSRCDAVECLCPKGRSHTGVNAKWELVLCRLCGSQGVHKACGHLKLPSSIWECAECVGMLRRTNEAAPCCTNRLTEATNEISEDESSSDSDISVGQNPSPLPVRDRPDSPPPPIISPIKLRPGPRSFKLQQAVQNAKSAELIKTGTSNTTVPANSDISLSSRSETNDNTLSNEKFNSEPSQTQNSLAEKGSLSTKSTCTETNYSIPEESDTLLETAHAKSNEARHRVAEVIVIDSDDEVEITTVKPKQNILTTKDGTQIPIHSLYQVPAEPQKAEGDVKVVESIHSQVSESTLRQSNGSPVTYSSIASDTSSLSNPLSPTFDPTVTPLLHPSSLLESPITSRNGIGIGAGKAFGNREDPELIFVCEVPKKDPVMNIKITNVTSVRQEDFANSFQEPNVISKIAIGDNVYAGGSLSDLLVNDGQKLRTTQVTKLVNGSTKLCSTGFQFSTIAIKDSNVKRKSDEYSDNNSSDLANKEVIGNRKRTRISESKIPGPVQQSMNIPWSINLNDVNGAIPILATSISLTCTSNSSKCKQSTATMQADDNVGGRMIYNPDTEKRNGFHKNSQGTSLASSVQNQTKINTNHVLVPNNEPTSYVHVSKVTKTYSLVKPQIPNNTNIHGTTHSNQQFTVDASKNLPEVSSGLLKPQTLSQQIPNSNKSLALTSHSIYQPHENVDGEIQRCSDSGGTLRTNLSASNIRFYDALPRNCTETATGSNGNQPNINNMLKTNHPVTQLATGFPISSGCDGDAGSSPAAEAGFTHQATSRSPVHPSTKPNTFTNADPTSGAGQSANDNSSISTCLSANPPHVQHSSPTTTRKYCDKPRMIPENVPLQNLKFHVLDPKIVQIVVYDTFALNIIADTGNLQITRRAAGPISTIEKQKLPQPFTQQSNSLPSKFGDIENYRNININKAHSLPKSQICSEISDTSKEFTSLTRSRHNPIVPKIKFDDNDVSSSAAAITDSKTRASCVLETKCNIRSKISDSYMNQASLARNGSYHCIKKMDSITGISAMNESLTCVCFEGHNRKSSCIQHKENLFKEKPVVYSTFSNNGLKLKNLCIRDDNIISVIKHKEFVEKMEQASVEMVKYKNSVRSVSFIDFCGNDKNEQSIDSSKASKCLVKNLDDSSELNPYVNCYNNFKDIVNRSSELNCNIKDLDANTQDSLINNCMNIINLDKANGTDKVSVDSNAVKFHKYFVRANSNESKVQVDDMNSISNTPCAVLSSDNINGDVSLRKPIDIAFADQINSVIDDNTPSTCVSGVGIKVSIDLNKIQNFIDSKPQLFAKHNCMRNKQMDERESQTLPNLVASKNLHISDSNKRLYFSETEINQNWQDTDNSQTRKRLKYDFGSREEKHPNS